MLYMVIERFKPGAAPETVRTSAEAAADMAARE